MRAVARTLLKKQKIRAAIDLQSNPLLRPQMRQQSRRQGYTFGRKRLLLVFLAECRVPTSSFSLSTTAVNFNIFFFYFIISLISLRY